MFTRSSELNHITNLMARPWDSRHYIYAHGWGIRPQFFKIVLFTMGIPPPPPPPGGGNIDRYTIKPSSKQFLLVLPYMFEYVALKQEYTSSIK